MRYRFAKRNKLCGELNIRQVYAEGSSAVSFPLRATWLVVPAGEPVRVMVVARKKLFRHAVDRNRIKRLMREAYRLNQFQLAEWCENQNCSLRLIVSYLGHELPGYRAVEKAMRGVFRKIAAAQSAPEEHEEGR